MESQTACCSFTGLHVKVAIRILKRLNLKDIWFDWYPEFDKPLGPPLGDAIRNGWTYQREFEHASVFVDLENKTAKIDWW